MFERWMRWMKRRGSCRKIYLNEAGRGGARVLYLERYFILRVPGRFGFFLHRFHLSDPDYVHDHPWGNVSLTLGNYREHWHDGTYTDRKPFTLIFRPALMLHKLELFDGEKPWSLFMHFKRVRQWGFFRRDQWDNADTSEEFEPLKSWIFPHASDMVCDDG